MQNMDKNMAFDEPMHLTGILILFCSVMQISFPYRIMAEILVDISILTHDTGVPFQPFDPKESP